MHFKMTVRAGLAISALTALMAIGPVAFGPAQPAMAATPKAKAPATRKAAPKPKPAPKAKPAAKKTAVGSTATTTVKNLIAAMQKKDRETIASAFNWQRFAKEMNTLIPGEGLPPATYKALLVETLDVEKAVSANLRVGQETKKGANVATVEMRRVFPSGSGGTSQIKTINILTLGKEKDGWRIFKLDSAQPVTAPPPPVQPAPQGMVPRADPGK